MVRHTFKPDGTLEDILAPYADACPLVSALPSSGQSLG